MIDFLGNSVYEIDLSHIEPVEILHGNYDHIKRFIKLIYEWTMFHTDSNLVIPKKEFELGSSANMQTLDTYGNVNSEIVYFNKKGEIDNHKLVTDK